MYSDNFMVKLREISRVNNIRFLSWRFGVYLEGGGGLDTGGALVLGGGGGASVVNVFTCVIIFIAALFLCISTSLKAASTPPCLSMKS